MKKKVWVIIGIIIIIAIVGWLVSSDAIVISEEGISFGPPKILDRALMKCEARHVGEPFVEVYTCADLKDIENDLTGSYKLMNDLNCDTFEPIGLHIGAFKGLFDGQGYSVSYDYSSVTHGSIGLFSSVGECGIVRKVRVDADVYGVNNVGAVAGHVYKGIIQEVSSFGRVEAEGESGGGAGGVVGGLKSGRIINSYSKAEVTGTDRVGGLVGAMWDWPASEPDPEIKNSYAFSNVIATGEDKGALVGYCDDEDEAISSYMSPSKIKIGFSVRCGERGNLKSQDTFIDWDFDKIWGIDEGLDSPYLKSQTGPGRISPIALNGSLDSAMQRLTDSDLPEVLADGDIGGFGITSFTQDIILGDSKLIFKKMPTSDYDPAVGFDLDKNFEDIYTSRIIFDQPVDLGDSRVIGKELKILGRDFEIAEGTTKSKLVLMGYDNIIIEDNEPVRNDGGLIDGTEGDFGFDGNKVTGIAIEVRNSRDKALLEGQIFKDPVFDSFGIDFRELFYNEASHSRESITIEPESQDVMSIDFENWDGFWRSTDWAFHDGNDFKLADSRGNLIQVKQMGVVKESHYTLLGEPHNGYLLKVNSITNSSSGFRNDRVILKDVFSEDIYEVNIMREGYGTFWLTGDEYEVYYWDDRTGSGNEHIRTRFLTERTEIMLAYSPMRTSEEAGLMLYEPINIDLDNYDGFGTDVELLGLPKNRYDFIPFNISLGENGEIFVDGNLLMAGQKTYYHFNPLGYMFYNPRSTDYDLEIYILDVDEKEVLNPGMVLFERTDNLGKDNVLIVTLEGDGTGANGVGVDDVQLTWGHDWHRLQLESNNDVYQSMDRWGSIVEVNQFDTDQMAAHISYVDNQVYADVYFVELI